uniref:BTB/POZ domain-containing protein n=2 Tax=Caenorhabditis tropicalis TaxID=1561998 RepID=A0A1I7USU6_9PELO
MSCTASETQNIAVVNCATQPTVTTISYVSRMLPTTERQKSIRGVHFITCRCEMCQNEQLDLLGLASRCQTTQCPGYVKGVSSCISCGRPPIVSMEESTQATSKLIDTLENLHKNSFESIPSEFNFLKNLRKDYCGILADCNVAILQLDEQIAYSASQLEKVPDDLEMIATRGYDHFIQRLGIGSPEVTRRLYIACKCLSRLPNPTVSSKDIMKLAAESSIISHGENHLMSKYLRDLLVL